MKNKLAFWHKENSIPTSSAEPQDESKSRKRSELAADRLPGSEIPGSSGQRKELEELILKLDLIQKDCVQEKLNEEKEALKDDFIAIMFKTLMEVKDLIRSRYQIQLKKGNSIEVIQMGSSITKKLEELDNAFMKMKEVFKRQMKQKGKKFSEEVLDQRFKEMQLIKQQIEESRSLFKNMAMHSDNDIATLSEFRSQIRYESLSAQEPQEWRNLTSEEQAIMDRWRARDQEIDRQVGEIGDAVDRLGEIALQIGDKAEKQSQLVSNLHQQADETNAQILSINNKIKNLLLSQGGMNFFCKIGMSFLLVALIGFIMTQIRTRIAS